ncbi:hypothetical protein BGZ98_009193 [Dissophora globulifera]|nr:hypothetical protein BGZ98_009193 [Dissophora globulifera]
MTKSKSKSKSKSGSGSGTKTGQGQQAKDSPSTTASASASSATTTVAQPPARGNTSSSSIPPRLPPIDYVGYESEDQLQGMVTLIENDLSEPYSIYTYRYFLKQWPKLSFLASSSAGLLELLNYSAIASNTLEPHGFNKSNRGYIAMLAVSKEYRKRRIGSSLVLMAIEAMKTAGADEIVLETEYTNTSAIALYQQIGFIKDKRLYRYYLNGVDAFRLKLFCKPEREVPQTN